MRKRITIDFSKAIDPEENSKEKSSKAKEQKSVANKKTDEATSKSDTKKEKKPTLSQILKKDTKISKICTFEGHKLTIKESKFIDEYIAHGNQRQAVIAAGYTGDEATASQLGNYILRKPYLMNEIKHRLEEHKKSSIADREEIMQFFSDMMRGKILDQFDLPTTNGDKIKAAVELAKRSVDIEDKIRERTTSNAAPEIKISLKWDDMKEGEENNEQ